MSYSDFKAQVSSEKLTLATLEAAKRLMGWSVHSGSIYKLENFGFQVISSIKDSGVTYAAVDSLGDVTASKYYLDRETDTLYLRSSDSSNPNSRFLVGRIKLFFSSSPITLSHDLNTGFEVYWEPLIQSTSQFGVEVDVTNQGSDAIESSGQLTLHNDQEFWPANFDKLYFDNSQCLVYSFNRNLDVSEAKLIFSGKVERKSYSSTKIQFSLKDLMSEIRTPLSLGTIGDLNARTGSDIENTRQRLVVGRVFGHRPVNIDQVVDGYPITGTVSVSYNSTTLTGSNTTFLSELSPDDKLILDGVEYTVGAIASNTSLTLTEPYALVAGLSGVTTTVIPEQPKRWMNRVWKIAGHALREPVTECGNGSTISQLYVNDNSDIYAGDWIYIGDLGSGELALVESVTGSHLVTLTSSLGVAPVAGTLVTRPAVQNVRIDDTLLVFYQDYTVDAANATITLTDTAEANSGPIKQLAVNLTFTSGSRTVTGTGLQGKIKPGYMVGIVGNSDFFEVLSVDSDTSLTLRTAATFSSTAVGRYKSLILDPASSVLSLDVLGKTDDGTSSGNLIKTAPGIIKMLLTDIGLSASLDTSSFEEAEQVAYMDVGAAFPASYLDEETLTYREIINSLSKSVLGTLTQNSDFQLSYQIIRPNKPTDALVLDESDILDITFEATSENIAKTTIVEYLTKEYDYLSGDSSFSTEQKTSDIANYILGTTREKRLSTCLVNSNDANLYAARWAFLTENGSGKAKVITKLQAIDLDVGNIVRIYHRKLFERYGSTLKSRLFFVEGVKKNGSSVQLTLVDLSNAFNRVANVTSSSSTWANATEDERLFSGYITDSYGLIDNDPDSYGSNVIW